MFEAVGNKVVYLKRITFGPLTLPEDLPIGEYIEITREDIIFE
jgi:16S rRNA pseudouridine516 synthase